MQCKSLLVYVYLKSGVQYKQVVCNSVVCNSGVQYKQVVYNINRVMLQKMLNKCYINTTLCAGLSCLNHLVKLLFAIFQGWELGQLSIFIKIVRNLYPQTNSNKIHLQFEKGYGTVVKMEGIS